MATVYERLKKIIVEQLAVEEEEVTPSASFADDLGALFPTPTNGNYFSHATNWVFGHHNHLSCSLIGLGFT